MVEKYWIGKVPMFDDFDELIDDEFIDGRTKRGPWAIMVPETHSRVGVGLGTGLGQRYKRQSDGRWLKIEG